MNVSLLTFLRLSLLACLLVSRPFSVCIADEAAITSEQIQFFEKSIRPLLIDQCFSCHSDKATKGNLRVDSLGYLLLGGDSGPAIVPGHPEKSVLIEAVRYESYEMPPSKKLSDSQIALLTRWIEMGAPWPGSDAQPAKRHSESGFSEAERSWWAFQPISDPPLPKLHSLSNWGRGEIDSFIAAELEKQNLTPAPEADRSTLLWRLSFDLIGLPPTAEEVQDFINDPDPQAYEKRVDRLLAQPEYGERWARHWLDLVRYAESDGFRADIFRPQAWRYRDYVIDSFNADKPYDRFVQEQIAGDELYPGDPDALIATGFLRHGMYEYNVPDVYGQWDNILNEMTDITADVFLGLGFQCARCHDHKFDPILQKDYFRLRAFFEAVIPRDDVPAVTAEELARHEQQRELYDQRTREVQAKLAQKLEPYLKQVFESTIKRYPDELLEVIRKVPSTRTPLERQYFQFIDRLVQYEQNRVDGRITGTDKDEVLALRRQLAGFDAQKPAALPCPMSVQDVGAVAPPTIIPKKNIEVQPGFLSILEPQDPVIAALPDQPNTTGRRATLARWMTKPDNPLTPRVIVNRIWQSHFGRGLVANGSDFGTLGDLPSHPELLDWLTSRFLQNDWKLKELHRLIVTSATYRQSPAHPNLIEYQQLDPVNQYYWRGDVRRLDAEQIRDAIFASTGRLAATRGGPSVLADQPRRSIYTRVMRNSHDPLMQAFDLPLSISSTSNRNTTTSPIQSLMMINSQTMLAHATHLADHVAAKSVSDTSVLGQITTLWWTLFGKAPTPEELDQVLAFLEQQKQIRSRRPNASIAPDVETGKIPYRDGQAVLFKDRKESNRFSIPSNDQLQLNNFSIEMYFQLRSIYESGAVRTLTSKMRRVEDRSGWLFAVTGKGSRRKPQTLVLQLFGKDASGQVQEAVIFSDHHIEINKPYYTAATVQLATERTAGKVVFYLKDLSNDDEPVIIYERPLSLVSITKNDAPLVIGSREGTDGRFDGLIDDVRLSNKSLPKEELLLYLEAMNSATVGYWQFEPHPGLLADSAPQGTPISPGRQEPEVSPAKGAFIDLCHVLLNSNEFLYVD